MEADPSQIPFDLMRPVLQAQAATAKVGWNPYLHNPKLPRSPGPYQRADTGRPRGARTASCPGPTPRRTRPAIPDARLVDLDDAAHMAHARAARRGGRAGPRATSKVDAPARRRVRAGTACGACRIGCAATWRGRTLVPSVTGPSSPWHGRVETGSGHARAVGRRSPAPARRGRDAAGPGPAPAGAPHSGRGRRTGRDRRAPHRDRAGREDDADAAGRADPAGGRHRRGRHCSSVPASVYGYLRFRLGQITSVKCTTCAAVADGAPYNVLIVGSDSRAGNTGGAAQAFGSASRSAASAATRSRSSTSTRRRARPGCCPSPGTPTCRSRACRRTGVGRPTTRSTPPSTRARPAHPDHREHLRHPHHPLRDHRLHRRDRPGQLGGGINLNFPYPVRDNDNGNNNSGLDITQAGCQTLNGNMALALARSRFYQYEVRPGYWVYDGSGDLGRIQRQNVIIEAVIDKARSSYNPLTLNAFLGSVVHDITDDQGMSAATCSRWPSGTTPSPGRPQDPDAADRRGVLVGRPGTSRSSRSRRPSR